MAIDVASIGRAALFLGVPFVLVIFFLQWKWHSTCSKNTLLKVVMADGSGLSVLAPKTGNHITIKNPKTQETKTWPMNKLCTVKVPYPGVGFVPKFLQKEIQEIFVDEQDWEPLLNRSAYMTNVASPDVKEAIKVLAESDGIKAETQTRLIDYANSLLTAPTREMIASPAFLGNMMHEKISEILTTVAKDVFEPLKEILKKMGKPINPTIVYILLSLNLILTGFALMKVLPQAASIDAIKQALGVVGG